MKKANWKDIAELIGIAAIVASLIFVGLQMKQSQDIAIAAQYQARAQAAQGLYMSLQESGTSLRANDKSFAEMTPAERDTAENIIRWAWTHYDNIFYQYSAGFLDEESWSSLKSEVKRVHSRCERRYVWEHMRRFLRPSFVEYVESLSDACVATK